MTSPISIFSRRSLSETAGSSSPPTLTLSVRKNVRSSMVSGRFLAAFLRHRGLTPMSLSPVVRGGGCLSGYRNETGTVPVSAAGHWHYCNCSCGNCSGCLGNWCEDDPCTVEDEA